MRRALALGTMVGAVLVGGDAGATPSLASPAFAPGSRTFVSFSGKPARIRIAWAPVNGATRYRAAWNDGGTRVDLELPAGSTVFERAEAKSGHHELTIVAVDDSGRESSPAAIALDVVTVSAIPPGATEPAAPTGRTFAVGSRFASPGLRCRIGEGDKTEQVLALRTGAFTLECGGESGQPRVEVPIVIAPVIVAAQAAPIRIGLSTVVHVALASAAEVGEDIDVDADPPFEIDDVERTEDGLDVSITATSIARGAIRVGARGVELGVFDVEAIAAPPPGLPPETKSDWFALDLGPHVGFFAPGVSTASNIGHPTDSDHAVSWGPIFGAHAGLFPTRRVGLELEAGLATTGYENQTGVSFIGSLRAQIAARVVDDRDFGLRIVAGADLLAQMVDNGTSHASATGGVHYGAAFVTHIVGRSSFRIEALHVIMPALSFDYAHGIEIQFGMTTRFGRRDKW